MQIRKAIKKLIPVTLGLLVAVSILASGCAGEENGKSSELSGTITEAGSTSVLPLAEKFALRFMELHPQVTITYTGGGSSAGVSQCAAGTVDLGAASRDVKITEYDLISYPVARDAVAIVVNSANTVTDLSLEQVAEIFAGDITDWSEVGGQAGGIQVYAREEGSGTRDCFEHGVTKPYDLEITNEAIFKKSNGEIQTAVADDTSGIGFVSLGYVSGLKTLTLEGVEPTLETCQSGEYPVLRRLYFLTLDAPSEVVTAFIDFCRGEEGQQIASDLGYIPLVIE